MVLVAVVSAFIVLLLIYNFYWKRRNFPPGPTPLPLVGNMLTLARLAPGYAAFQQWRTQYGPIYTYWIGEIPIVAVTDYATIKETFIRNGDAYAGRDFFGAGHECLTVFSEGIHGVGRTQGEEWRVLRRFAVQALKDIGMGKAEMEEVILDEVNTLFELVDESIKGPDGGRDVNTMARVDAAVGSVITRLLFGYQLKREAHTMFARLKKMVLEEAAMEVNVMTKLCLMMPSLRYLPFFSSAFAAYDANMSQQFAFYDDQIQRIKTEREKNTGGSKPRTYVEAFLAEMDKAEELNGRQFFTHLALRGSCFELYAAGQVSLVEKCLVSAVYRLAIYRRPPATRLISLFSTCFSFPKPKLRSRKSLTLTVPETMSASFASLIAPSCPIPTL